MSAPDKIYLQWGVDEDFDVTWCVDQIDETDVEYCRITAEELSALRRVAEAAIKWESKESLVSKDVFFGDHFDRALTNAVREYKKCVK